MAKIDESQLFTTPLESSVRRVQTQLRASPYWPVRQLVCEINRDRIVVRGTVPCYYLKQVAQTVALKVAGAGRVESDVKVHAAEANWATPE